MRVLHVLNELKPSGAETMLRLAASRWKAGSLDLHILSCGDELGEYALTLRDAGYRLHHIPLFPFKHFLSRYVRLLRAGRFDIVHIHSERANFPLALVARLVGRCGVVRTVHNIFSFSGLLRLKRRIQRRTLRAAGVRHIAIGVSVEANERKRFGNRTALIWNTFDEDLFTIQSAVDRSLAREALRIDQSAFVALVIGNCSDIKNHAALLEALALPSAVEIELLHVGMEQEERTGERALTARLGVSEQVRFLGHVRDVPTVLQAADAYVMPSRHEGLGIAALEALGAGLPAVLADVPGLRDLRPFVPDAWWIEPRPELIAEALAEIQNTAAEDLRAWSAAASASIRSSFGLDRFVRQHLLLYESLRSNGTRP